MDQKTKRIIFLIGVLVVGGIALYWVIKFWWTFIVVALAFGIGYFMGKSDKKGK